MRSNTRLSLITALSSLSLRELPEEYNGEDVWIKALALVEKNTGEKCFVSLSKDPYTLTNKVTRDFGSTGSITKYISIHPYLYLSDNFMPKFRDKNKDSRVEYLKRLDRNVVWSKKTLKELNETIIGFAIMMQLNNMESNINYSEDDKQGDIETEDRGDESED